jgi:hypothetical protein
MSVLCFKPSGESTEAINTNKIKEDGRKKKMKENGKDLKNQIVLTNECSLFCPVQTSYISLQLCFSTQTILRSGKVSKSPTAGS